MTILALDHGEKRIGAAFSDSSGSVALGLETIEVDDCGGEIEKVREIVEKRGVETIVVGLPKHMDGSEGQRARRVRGFVKRLRRVLPDVRYEFVDERYTSVQANRVLSEEGADRDARKKNVDRVAAQFILRRFCDRPDDTGA